MFNIFLTEKAAKELEKIASSDRKKVLKKLSLLSDWPSVSLNIKKLISAPGFYRLRIDRIRVIFEVDFQKRQIWIRKIAYRGLAYR